MIYENLQVSYEEKVCNIKINRPNDNNSINEQLVIEFLDVLKECEDNITIIVIEGSEDVFCSGADFKEIKEQIQNDYQAKNYQHLLYDLWIKLTTGPYITVAHVYGKANAGGIGFVASCDFVLANNSASFSLSEMLFGIYPACVMPFLIKRIGVQHANFMTLSTKSITAEKACTWGLVDDYSANSNILLKNYLVRLKCLSKASIVQYKNYMKNYVNIIEENKDYAVMSNKKMFSNETALNNIINYLDFGKLPWK